MESSVLTSGWKSYEACDLNGIGLISKELAGKKDLHKAINKMSLMECHGWPDGIVEMRIAQKKEEGVWLLKCQPSCWRLYFYVEECEKKFIYVSAVCKKRDAEDPASCKRAANIREKIRSKQLTTKLLPFG